MLTSKNSPVPSPVTSPTPGKHRRASADAHQRTTSSSSAGTVTVRSIVCSTGSAGPGGGLGGVGDVDGLIGQEPGFEQMGQVLHPVLHLEGRGFHVRPPREGRPVVLGAADGDPPGGGG